MERHEWDAIVIGGGPAGAVAAAGLAARGRSVLVLERASFPRFHIGESMLTYTAALLGRLGVLEAVERGGFVVKRGAEFTNASGRFIRVDFEDQGAGRVLTTFQVERAQFDQLLLDHARAQGAQVVEGARVTGVCLDGERITGVTYRVGDDLREAGARYVLDASGRAGVVAHQHLKARVQNERLQMVAVFRHYENVDESTNPGVEGDIQIGSHADGWVWAIPIRRGKLSVGVVTRAENVQASSPERVFDEYAARISRIHQRLQGAEAVLQLKGESDFCYFTERLAGPGYLVVGDAGCFVDPVFSAGVYLGMVTGMKAAETAAAVLAGEEDEAAAQERYARFYKTGYDCYFRLIYAFYEHDFSIGRYLRSIGEQVDPKWVARLLGGDFWSRNNPLAQLLRGTQRYDTFQPFERLFGCPVYPSLDALETHAPKSLSGS